MTTRLTVVGRRVDFSVTPKAYYERPSISFDVMIDGQNLPAGTHDGQVVRLFGSSLGGSMLLDGIVVDGALSVGILDNPEILPPENERHSPAVISSFRLLRADADNGEMREVHLNSINKGRYESPILN